MCPKVREKAARFPNYPSVEGIEKFRTFAEFDGRFTAPLYGYASAQDYWRENSSLPWLPSHPDAALYAAGQGRPLLLAFLLSRGHGGQKRDPASGSGPARRHVGFARPGRDYYSEERIRDFVRSLW